MISITKYLFEDEGIMNNIVGSVKRAFDPDTVGEAGKAAKRLAGRVGKSLSNSGETVYDLTHSKVGSQDIENRFQLARAVSTATNPEVKEQWGKFLKKR